MASNIRTMERMLERTLGDCNITDLVTFIRATGITTETLMALWQDEGHQVSRRRRVEINADHRHMRRNVSAGST